MRVRVIGHGEQKTFQVRSVTHKADANELWLECADGKHAVLTVKNVEIEVTDSFVPPMGSYEIRRMVDANPLITAD
jgi:hypothetical protein